MCRWMVYKGQEVLLADVVTRPPNSIIHQSRHSPYLPYIQGTAEEIKARNHAINGDGFGVAWYDHICPDEPCVFTSIQPSWHCSNLQNLANHIRTHCIFAHVRAASPGSLIAQSNCHPFKFGRLVFMHNGGIAHFEQIKYAILHTIQHTSACYLRGTTDSEHAGALLVHYLGDPTAVHDGHALKAAMLKMMSHLVGLIRWQESKMSPHKERDGSLYDHMPSSLNFAVSDGRVVIATRYRDSKEQDPPSLYYSEAQQMQVHEDDSGTTSPLCWKYPCKKLIDSIVISSEPLSKDAEAWKLVPRNHLLVVTNTQRTIIEPIHLRTLYSSSDSVDVFEPDKSATELAEAGKWDESQAKAIQPPPPPQVIRVPSQRGYLRRGQSGNYPMGKAKEAKPDKKGRSTSIPNKIGDWSHKKTGSADDKSSCEDEVKLPSIKEEEGETGTSKHQRRESDGSKNKLKKMKREAKRRQEQEQKAEHESKESSIDHQTSEKRPSTPASPSSSSTSSTSPSSSTTLIQQSTAEFWRGLAVGLLVSVILLILVFVRDIIVDSSLPAPSICMPPSSSSSASLLTDDFPL